MATPYRVVFNEQQISAQRVAKHMRHLCYADLCAESCKTHASSMLCRSLRRELQNTCVIYVMQISAQRVAKHMRHLCYADLSQRVAISAEICILYTYMRGSFKL